MRASPRLCLGALLPLLPGAGASCGIYGPVQPELFCYRGLQCCSLMEDNVTRGFVELWSQRSAVPEILIGQLATGYPVYQDGSIRSMHFDPVNVESTGGGPIQLTLVMSVSQMTNINQKEQTFEMQYRMAWSWRDCRLVSGCHLIRFDAHNPDYAQFWEPHIEIEEEVGARGDATNQFFIMGNGLVTLTQQYRSTFRCSFHFAEMPFDTQRCKLTIRAPDTYDFTHRLYVHSLTTRDLANVEWDIPPAEDWSRSNGLIRPYATPYLHNESIVEIGFAIKRKPAFLIKQYVFPSVLFYVVSWVGLWIEHAAVPARAAIGVIPVLIMTNTLLAVQAAIPPIGYATRLQSMMLCTLMFISLHMLEFGLTHFAWKVKKRAIAAEKRVADEPGLEAGAEAPTSLHIGKDRVVNFLSESADCHLRWASPMVYALCIVFIMVVR